MHRIGILVGRRGRGTNMSNLIRAGREGLFPGEVSAVFGTFAEAPALAIAKELGVKTIVVDESKLESELASFLEDSSLVCLAGYMRLIPPKLVHQFPRRMLNIHPALLPKFGGKGMYGDRVHTAVLAAGEEWSGCTVHYVSDQYDEGEVITQLRCRVEPDETVESLAAKVLALEHKAYPLALNEALKRL